MKIQKLNGLETEFYRVLVIENVDLDFDVIEELFDKTSFSVPLEGESISARRFRVDRVESVQEGVVELKNPASTYDAVLVSTKVPDNDGVRAIRLLTQLAGFAPVLPLVNIGDEETDVKKALRNGAISFLSKSVILARGAQYLTRAILQAIAAKEGRELDVDEGNHRLLRNVRFKRVFFCAVVAGFIFVGQPSYMSKRFAWDLSQGRRELTFVICTLAWSGKAMSILQVYRERRRRTKYFAQQKAIAQERLRKPKQKKVAPIAK